MRPASRNALVGLAVAAVVTTGVFVLRQEPTQAPVAVGQDSQPVKVVEPDGGQPGKAPGSVSSPSASPAPSSTYLPIPEPSGPADPIEPVREPYVDDAVASATKVLVALGSAEGADQSSPSSWLTSIDDVLTEAGRSSLVGEGEVDLDRPTPVYETAHEKGWTMSTQTECDVNAGAGLDPAALALNCLAVTTTVDSSGQEVGPEVTGSWPYQGEPVGRVMSMVNDGSGWRFDGFAQAS